MLEQLFKPKSIAIVGASSITPGTASLGTTITTRSIGSLISLRFLYGITGYFGTLIIYGINFTRVR